MQQHQEVSACPNCGTHLTLSAQRERRLVHVTRFAVKCPVCRSSVAFAIRGLFDPETATLVCYERPRLAQRRALPTKPAARLKSTS
jgi:endogenous inhibitor of DNA gyrase (YacG/DUF329 family)